MHRPSLGLIAIILTVAVLMPMATSAGPGETIATPTPGAARNPTGPSADDAGAELIPMTTLDQVLGDLPGVTNLQQPAGTSDPEELEAFRRDLLELADVIEALYPYAEAYAQATGEALPPRVNRALIRSLTYEQLAIVRNTFGEAYEPFKQDLQALKVQLRTAAQQSFEESAPARVAPDSAALNASTTPPSSIRLIPAPTPVTSAPPGITHQNHDNTNKALGDLPQPNYPTSVGCPQTRFPNPATLTTLIATQVAREVDDFAEEGGCEGTFIVVAVPFGGGTNLPGCLGWAVLKGITLAAEAVDAGLNFCIGRIDSAELEAARKNVRILHAELAMHDQNLRDRMNDADNFLFHFRNLNLRLRLEANLASEDDDLVALFALPNSICINGIKPLSLQEEQDPSAKFAPERVAGCGLLEVVSDTVKSAIDMTRNANLDIHNAEVERQAAIEHYRNGEYKLAYERFRKAYRELTKP